MKRGYGFWKPYFEGALACRRRCVWVIVTAPDLLVLMGLVLFISVYDLRHMEREMPKFIMLLSMFLLSMAVTGCVSVEDQRSMDQDKCSSFGYRPGTDRFADCMMEQSSQRAENEQRAQDRIAAQERRKRERRQARRDDRNLDTRPSYDRDGNPNFDTKGNYQGCRGIGCEVDNPDDDDN